MTAATLRIFPWAVLSACHVCLWRQGVFLDDDISATGGFAENCNL